MSTANLAFKLSEPGASLGHEPTMREYLSCYEFPQPPDLRYGYLRFESPQPDNRVSLFGQVWLPDHALGTVLLLHGYSEHAGNFSRLVRSFTDARFAVATLDFRGHGLSEGPRGHIQSPDEYVEDAETFLNIVFPHLLPNRPLFLWGHSLGGMVGLQLLLRGRTPVKPSAACFTSALLGFPDLSPTQKVLSLLSPLIAKIFPTLPVSHNIPDPALSHDSQYLEQRKQDPLIHRVTTPQWYLSIRTALNELHAQASEFQKLAPTLFLLAGQEQVTNLTEARRFAFTAYSGLKHKVIEFPGYFHELEKEPEIRERIISECLAWYRSHGL